MKSRNKRKCLLGLLAASMLTGCSGEDMAEKETDVQAVSAGEQQDAPLTFPEAYEEEVDDTLSFHAVIVPPAGLQKKNTELHITYGSMDFEKALERLFSDVGELQKEEMILQPGDELHQSAYNQQDEGLTNSSYGLLRMEKRQWKKVRNAIELSRKDVAYNVQRYTAPQEFSFGTAEAVWESLQKELQYIGVETELRPTFFYMDYETTAEEAEKHKDSDEFPSEVEKTWDETDNGYYIAAVQCIDGNTVFANTYYGMGIEGEADTANVLAYVTQDGVQMLEVSRIFNSITKTEKSWEMLPFEDIVEAVKKRFSLTITGDKADVKEFRFSYMTEAVGEEVYRLLPVWFCNYEQTGADGEARLNQIIINASTGEEVIYEL